MSKQNSPLVLGTERISKLLTQYAIPAIIAMTASSLYNMADSIFIGHGVGPLAISGLALTFPLMNLAAAFGSLVGVGASTLVSVKLGQKDYEGAPPVKIARAGICTTLRSGQSLARISAASASLAAFSPPKAGTTTLSLLK